MVRPMKMPLVWFSLLAMIGVPSLGHSQDATQTDSTQPNHSAQPDHVIRLWPATPPDLRPSDAVEADTSTPDSNKVAQRSVIRLGNVQSPELHVFVADPATASQAAIVICPGGGYSILAWDLEGTEIATWLQGIGVTAAVVKYRVPTRGEGKNWLAPVQDIQRSVELLRSGSIDGVNVEHVGVLGFSAGGNAAARTATTKHKYYRVDPSNSEAITRTNDDATSADEFQSVAVDFAVLVYPAWLVEKEEPSKLIAELQVDVDTPPMFFAHARNDGVTCMSSVALFTKLQQNDIPSALHVFADGGHGFGARPVNLAHDRWPMLCEDWMRDRGWLAR